MAYIEENQTISSFDYISSFHGVMMCVVVTVFVTMTTKSSLITVYKSQCHQILLSQL